MIVAMPRDGAIIFADLIGKLDVPYVHCLKCNRTGRYRVQHLVEERGRNAKLIDWLDEITVDCVLLYFLSEGIDRCMISQLTKR